MPHTRTQDDTAITLLPQEQRGHCRFGGPFVATTAAVARFGDGAILAALELVKREAAVRNGLDYLAVLDVGDTRLWIIDDGVVVTGLLPSDF